MAAPQPPPYPGFRSDMISGPGPAYPQQQFAPYPQQQYAPGQQFPPQQFPPQAQQFPPQAPPFPKMQAPGQGYGPPPGGVQGNFTPYGMPPSGDTVPMTSADAEFKDDIAGWNTFSNKAIRAVFVRKVYLILMVQLLFTLAVISLFVFERNVKLFVRRNIFMYYISYAIFLGVYIALACCGNLRRQYPTNMILLSIFTVSMSYMMGTISSFYDTNVVLMAVGICAAVCLAVSVFSFHTKFDFTSCGGVLFILVWVLFLFGILTIFTYNSIMQTIYAGCGALLFTLFLAYDTQMLMGGKKYELSPEEHIFAAMQIYLDIVYIFMFLLSILGSGKSN